MKCINCGVGDLVHETRDVSYVYKGQQTILEGITGDFCDSCGEYVTDSKETRRVMGLMLAFNKKVNTQSYSPNFIFEVRKKLELDQKEAAVIFGGGANAFSRYENGTNNPPVALVKLFKVLNNHPELLEEIRT